MRLFKWSTTFRCSEESPVVPVWISLPFLPVHLVHCKEALFSIAAQVGKPLRTDHATALLNRPNVARILVEFDVSQEFIDKIWIEEGEEGFWQDVIFEAEPKYCLSCKHLGHRQSECFIDNPALRESRNRDRGNTKTGDDTNKSATERAPQGVPKYVPVSKPPPSAPIASMQGHVPLASTDIAPDTIHVSVPATTLSVSAPVTLGNTTLPLGTTVTSPVSTQLQAPVTVTSTVSGSTIGTTNRYAVLDSSPPVIAVDSIAPSRVTVEVAAPLPAMGSTPSTFATSAFVPYSSPIIPHTSTITACGTSSLSAGALDFVPSPCPGILNLPTSLIRPPLHSPYPVPPHGTQNVAYNYPSESIPSNKSFAVRHFGSSHSARLASSDDESVDNPYFGPEHDGFPSEPEPMHENDCTRELLDSMGSASAARHIDAYLDDFQQVTRRSDRLRSKKAKGFSVGDTVTGRKKRR